MWSPLSLLALLSAVLLLASFPSVLAQSSSTTSSLNFCYTASSYPNSPYGPWTIVITGALTVNSTAVITPAGIAPASAGGLRPANAIVSATATRSQVNRDGSTQTATLGLCATSVQGSDNLIYSTKPYTDWNGFCLQVLTATDAPAGQAGWLVYPNGFPSQQIEVYYDLPSENYPNLYHADNPFNPQLTVSASPLICTAPSTAPQVAPATTTYQFCYQAYGTIGATPWSSAIGGSMLVRSTPGLTADSAAGYTAPAYGQYVLSVQGTRLQSNGSVTSPANPIVGVSWINPGGLDGNDGNPDSFLLSTVPHLAGSCASGATPNQCFGGLVLYAATPFYFPNNIEQIDSSYALVNAVDLRNVNGSVFEASGPVPTFSQLAVSPLASGAAAACPLISTSGSAVTSDASPLFSTTAAAAATTFNVTFAYYLNSLGFNLTTSTPLSANGYWTVQVEGFLTVQAFTGTAPRTGAASNATYPTTYLVVGATGQRIYTDATGATTVSAITGVAPVAFVYTAGSSLQSAFGNNNLLYVNPTTSSGYGYGSWTVDASGLALTIQAPASAPLGNPGLPGFPTTAQFNQVLYLQLRSSGTQLREKAWGPINIDNGIAAPSSFTAEVGLSYSPYTTSMGVQLYPNFNPLPVSLVSQAVAYQTVGLCYIITPDELQQNGMWTIATSALLYVSPQVFSVPFGLTNGSGTVIRQAQLAYAMTQVTRTYVNQYGQVYTSTGAVLQGQGGDGGSDNLLYTSTVAGDREGLIVDGDGLTYTLLGGGAVTPGDPTLALGINFYSEFNYREAAEPWHQDGEYGGAGTVLTLTPGATTAPSCVAAPFQSVPQLGGPATLAFTFCYAITGAAFSVVTAGVFTTSATAFTSFNSANSLFYYIGQGISGSRTYTPSGGAAQVSQITSLPGPGGDGQFNQKYYFNTSYLLDSGGWGYTVSPSAQVPQVAGTSSIVRVYNSGSTMAGPWLEVGLPQLNGTSASAVSASAFYIQPYLGSTYSTCTPTTSTITTQSTAVLCMIMYALPGNVDYPWSSSTSLTIAYSTSTVTTPYGTAVTILSGTGTRVFTNRFGKSSSTVVTIAPVGTGSSNNLLYLNSPLPFDVNGTTLAFASPVQEPGHGPTVLYSTANVYNASGGIVEAHASRIDPLGSAFLSSVQGFTNVTIGASNINSLAANYGACQAPISFTNGLRVPTQPSASNGARVVLYSYYISDGSTYSVQANLTLTMNSAFATSQDVLGNPYQNVTAVTGSRLYTYLPTMATVLSSITGLSTASYQYADQRFYPYSLLASAPGTYTINTVPFVDYDGIEFSIFPSSPVNGAAPGTAPQYNATSIYVTSSSTTAVLTEGYYVTAPLASLQQQTYTFSQ